MGDRCRLSLYQNAPAEMVVVGGSKGIVAYTLDYGATWALLASQSFFGYANMKVYSTGNYVWINGGGTLFYRGEIDGSGAVQLLSSVNIDGVGYNGTHYIAATAGNFYTSSDASTFTSGPTTTNTFRSMGTDLVTSQVFGAYTTPAFSAQFMSTPSGSASPIFTTMDATAQTNSLASQPLVIDRATGYFYTQKPNTLLVYKSVDGVNWALFKDLTGTPGVESRVTSLAVTPSFALAFHDSGGYTKFTSSAATYYNSTVINNGFISHATASASGVIYAMNQSNSVVMQSSDGVTWSQSVDLLAIPGAISTPVSQSITS